MMLVLVLLASAGPEAWPWSGALDLPDDAAARVVLPPETLGADLAGLEPEALSARVRVEDARGGLVPHVVRTSRVEAPETVGLRHDQVERTTFEVSAADRPLDRLRLRFDDLAADGPFRVTVQAAEGGGWRTLGAPTVIWALADEAGIGRETVEVGGRTGPFRVIAEPLAAGFPSLDDVVGEAGARDRVAPVVDEVVPEGPFLLEDGWARYVVRLPATRAVTAVELVADGEVYDREVRLGGPSLRTAALDDAFVAADLLGSDWMAATGRVRRIRLGGATVDAAEVRLPVELATERLWVDVRTDRGRTLPVRAIRVVALGAELVLSDPGPPPQAIWVGARDEAVPTDLGTAIPELVRLAGPPRPAPVLAPNPGFVPAPTREGLDGPGPVANLRRLRWVRAVEGAPGWVRVPLDAHVLAHARAGLADLRVVDAEGRLLPYLLEPEGELAEVALGPIERTEDGSRSHLAVSVPDPDLPLDTVLLTTPATRFERTVEILRDRGRATETLRVVPWVGDDVGSTLAVEVGQAVGNRLLVRLENGDDPPLPVEAVRATRGSWALRVRLPEGGARLAYGGPGVEAPSFDLALLRDEVLRMPVGEGRLGEPEEAGRDALGAGERAVVLGAVGLLALGLVGLALRAARSPAPPLDTPETAE